MMLTRFIHRINRSHAPLSAQANATPLAQWSLLLSVVLFGLNTAWALSPDQPVDVLLINGRIIDGTGSPWYHGELAITGDRIVAVGALQGIKAKKIIDVHNRVIAPGFIDMLGQSELSILVDPKLPSKIYQGITTEITGEGNSVAPLNKATEPLITGSLKHYGLTAQWGDFTGYFNQLRQRGMGINLGTYIGASTVRAAIVGYDNRPATASELLQMQALVADGMRQGALGVSSSLQYAPAPYASTEELIALAQTAASFGGVYATHMRSEGAGLLAALDETFAIGDKAHIPVEIWHLKAAGKAQFGLMPTVVNKINQARARGIDVAADTYGYTAWYNSMSAFIPPWAHEGGDQRLISRLKNPKERAKIRTELLGSDQTWDNEWQEVGDPNGILIGVTHNPKLHDLQGKTIAEIAASRHSDPIDTLMDILIEDDALTECAVFGMQESDVALGVTQPWMSFNNDSSGTSPEGVLGKDHPHPRAYGTFPHALKRYVRDQKLVSLEAMIQKFSSLPASRLHLSDRGVIKTGMKADLVVFDPESITDLATFAEPNQLSRGMEWVFVNGKAVIDQGVMTGALPGEVILGPGATR